MSSELEQKIASVLGGNDGDGSTDIAALIGEVEAAAAAADADAAKAREDALNPAVVIDVAAVSAAVTAAELTRDRLKAAVPRLQARWHEVALAESLAVWREDFEAVEGGLDELVAEFEDRYPKLVDELVSLMKRAAEVDRKVTYVLVNRPPGAQGYLESVEETVRGKLTQSDVRICEMLRLPVLHRNGGVPYAYPLPQPSLAVAVAGGIVPRHIDGSTWHKEIAERNARLLSDAAKSAAESEKRQAEREAREQKEIEAAKEADRQAYREHGWPPPGP
jgi:hypothetical protein